MDPITYGYSTWYILTWGVYILILGRTWYQSHSLLVRMESSPLSYTFSKIIFWCGFFVMILLGLYLLCTLKGLYDLQTVSFVLFCPLQRAFNYCLFCWPFLHVLVSFSYFPISDGIILASITLFCVGKSFGDSSPILNLWGKKKCVCVMYIAYTCITCFWSYCVKSTIFCKSWIT